MDLTIIVCCWLELLPVKYIDSCCSFASVHHHVDFKLNNQDVIELHTLSKGEFHKCFINRIRHFYT